MMLMGKGLLLSPIYNEEILIILELMKAGFLMHKQLNDTKYVNTIDNLC